MIDEEAPETDRLTSGSYVEDHLLVDVARRPVPDSSVRVDADLGAQDAGGNGGETQGAPHSSGTADDGQGDEASAHRDLRSRATTRTSIGGRSMHRVCQSWRNIPC